MNKVFIDTSGWITLLNKDEVNHTEAVNNYSQLHRVHHLYTSNLVIGETYTWLRRKAGPDSAFVFLERLKQKEKLNQLVVIYSNPPVEEIARNILYKYRDQTFSYVDAVSFAIMKTKKIDQAFAYDHHFVTAGFNLLFIRPL